MNQRLSNQIDYAYQRLTNEVRMRKPTKSSLTTKLDTICSLIVRSRGACEKCGLADYSKLQAAHIFSRVYRSVRWDCRDNILCLCQSCHFHAHRNPILFADWLKDVMGERYEILKKKAQEIKKWTLSEMVELYKTLKDAHERGHTCGSLLDSR